MALNKYFQNGAKSEQNLYESLVIESIQIHGIDVYYIPRKIIKRDFVLNEDVVSTFDKAFKVEMYVEEMEGFEGDSKIYEKFGLEVRDEMTLRVAKYRWNQLIQRHGYADDAVRPREGDLIYVPLYKSIFEIRYSDSKTYHYLLLHARSLNMKDKKLIQALTILMTYKKNFLKDLLLLLIPKQNQILLMEKH